MRPKTLIWILLGLALAGLVGFYVLTIPSLAVNGPLPPRTADLANGETMFNIGGCASCHATPKQDDHRRLGGGLALATPFGTFKVSNISPDPTHGIGGWSEEAFVNAMLRGVGRNGEHLYPAFPYTSYQRMPLGDVRDLFAFMKTLPAEATPSEPHALPFPFNVRRGLGLWKLLHLKTRTFTPDPGLTAELNRGAYLVEGPGHCAECHSPRNLLGGIIEGSRFGGGLDAEQRLGAEHPPHADGLAAWSLRTSPTCSVGLHARERRGGLGMADVVLNTANSPRRPDCDGGLHQVAASAARQSAGAQMTMPVRRRDLRPTNGCAAQQAQFRPIAAPVVVSATIPALGRPLVRCESRFLK
jgi:mono/diheme cytochrome c family protein